MTRSLHWEINDPADVQKLCTLDQPQFDASVDRLPDAPGVQFSVVELHVTM